MFKNFLFLMILSSLAFLSGCQGNDQQAKPAIKIGSIEISAKEFDEAFKSSQFAHSVDSSSKKNFLQEFITKKLMLKEAEKLGLDKDPEFLEDIQIFWEQSLMKRLLAKKANEFLLTIRVDDAQIAAYYNKHKDDYYIGKELPEVYEKIKWFIIQNRQRAILEAWVESLKKHTEISFDSNLLGI